jgi:hypothetical protein
VLDPAEVAEPLLADGGDEVDRAPRAHAAPVDLLGQGEHRGEAAAVVADARAHEPPPVLAHAERRVEREHRVEMGADGDRRRVLRTGAAADHVPGGVDAYVGESVPR